MTGRSLRRALWISDYFPRPHDTTTGTWALESVAALNRAGLPTMVLAPTPWIPSPLAVTPKLRDWSRTSPTHDFGGVQVFYPRCPHYPRRWVNNVLYNKVPFLDTALLWPWIERAARRVMASHPFDVMHANFLFPSGYLGMRLKQAYGVPLVVHERSVQRMALARENPGRRQLYCRILRAADLVLTENKAMAAELRELEPAVADVRVVMQPGADPGHVAAMSTEKPAALLGKQVILSVGTLSERKGHAILVRAMAEVRREMPDVVCRIIGDGPERSKLAKLVEDLGLEGVVELCGKRPHAEVLGAMSWCDVFALPSWGEASGTVYGEAMQFGKPVIACEGEGIADIVQDEVHGRLVPARDAAALAAAIRWLFADDTRRVRLGSQARVLGEAKLSYPGVARSLIEMYGALVSRRVA
jgi:teichuronic acid biosynthesis glycosyltransferase TuaC